MRIVFSDLDDTLLTTDKHVSDATRSVLEELGRRGIEFVPCSGRAISGIPRELRQLDACHYVACSNGATICEEATGKVLHQVLMGPRRARELYERVRDLDVTFDLFIDGVVWSQAQTFERLRGFDIPESTLQVVLSTRTRTDLTPDELIDRCEREGSSLERVTIFWNREEDARKVIAAVGEDPSLTWTNSVPHDIEVLDAQASKGTALEWLCRYLGIPMSESVAFGDGLNDAPMLRAAGLGVAMANAMPATKEAADVVTLSNDEDGVARKLRKLLGLGR